MTSILNAHRRYHPFPIRGRDLDRYFDETAIVPEKIGEATTSPAAAPRCASTCGTSAGSSNAATRPERRWPS